MDFHHQAPHSPECTSPPIDLGERNHNFRQALTVSMSFNSIDQSVSGIRGLAADRVAGPTGSVWTGRSALSGKRIDVDKSTQDQGNVLHNFDYAFDPPRKTQGRKGKFNEN